MLSIRPVRHRFRVLTLSTVSWLVASAALAQGVTGTVRDQTGGALPGVTVEARAVGDHVKAATTDATGMYRLDLPAGHYELIFSLVNFAPVHRSIELVTATTRQDVDAVLRFVLSADVTGRASERSPTWPTPRLQPKISSALRSRRVGARSPRSNLTPVQ